MCVRLDRRKLRPYSVVSDFVSVLGYAAAVSSADILDWPSLELPVGDAIALGTLRTRLETRTKESNMCASHWDI